MHCPMGSVHPCTDSNCGQWVRCFTRYIHAILLKTFVFVRAGFSIVEVVTTDANGLPITQIVYELLSSFSSFPLLDGNIISDKH
jgi:hypothetical protein